MFIMHKTFMISCKLRIVQKTVYIDAQFHSKLCTKSYANAENIMIPLAQNDRFFFFPQNKAL